MTNQLVDIYNLRHIDGRATHVLLAKWWRNGKILLI